jgi:hypothetical protein
VTKLYKRWRRQAAKQFKCSQAAIDRAVKEGCDMLHAAYRANNPMAKLFVNSYEPMFSAGFKFWLYAQNPLLKLLLKQAGEKNESPFVRPRDS